MRPLHPSAGQQFVVRLLARYIEDRSKGKAPADAGWHAISKSEESFLRMPGLKDVLELSGSNKARLRLERTTTARELGRSFPALQGQISYAIDEAHKVVDEERKAERALRTLGSLVTHLRRSPGDWPMVVYLGWKRMLESGQLGIPVDTVLAAGFSPRDWLLRSSQTSEVVAARIAHGIGPPRVSSELAGLLKSASVDKDQFSGSRSAEPADVVRLLDALSFSRLDELVSAPGRKLLGLLWCAYLMWESSDQLPGSEEIRARLSEDVFNAALGAVGGKPSMVDDLLTKLEEHGLVWATTIISPPELV